jgi:acyl-CoA hydrolase
LQRYRNQEHQFSYASNGGQSCVCVFFTYIKRGVMKSRIVLDLTFANDVAGFGIVNLKGKSVAQRAKALISVAHRNFRQGLDRQTREQGLIPKGFTFAIR